MLLYVDSSALVKLFVRESGSERMVSLYESVAQDQIVTSALTPIEVRSAIRRRIRDLEITPAHADFALNALLNEARRIVVLPLEETVLQQATLLLDRRAIRALDALQLGTALVARKAGLSAPITFACSDKRLLAAAEAEGFLGMDPENAT